MTWRTSLAGAYRLEVETAASSLVDISVEGDTSLSFTMTIRDSKLRPLTANPVVGELVVCYENGNLFY